MSTHPTPVAIDVRGVTKSFERLQVLRGVDLTVETGHILALSAPTEPERPPW